MENQSTEQQPMWAIIELMGHIRYGGLVSKDSQLMTAMLRVDVPQKNGTFISQLINPASVYRLTFTSEDLARAAAAHGDSAKPFTPWEIERATPALGSSDSDDDDQVPL